MGFLIKICGLRNADAVDVAIDAGADMIGLVLFPPSPRNVSVAEAARLAERARGRLQVVALTVDADNGLLDEAAAAIRPDWLQCHGREAPERIAAIKAGYPFKVMKALGISSAADIDAAAAYSGHADLLLFDAKPPKGAKRPGGLGQAFDWRLLDRLDPGLAFMLSGGLDISNVETAILATRAGGVDVSSGVESAPGVKDQEKINAFVALSRRAAEERKTR